MKNPQPQSLPPAAGEVAHTPTPFERGEHTQWVNDAMHGKPTDPEHGEPKPKLKTYQRPEWKGWYKLTRTTVAEVYGTPPTTALEANAILSRAESRGNDTFTTHTAGDEHPIAVFPKEARQ